MKPLEFDKLLNLGYLKLYLVTKMVFRKQEQQVEVEIRISTNQWKIEAETLKETLLSYPLIEGWMGHHTLAYQINLNRLASSFDSSKLYIVVIAYRKNFIWNNHLHWFLVSNLRQNQDPSIPEEVQYFMDHWLDDNDIYVEPNAISTTVCVVPTREQLFLSIADWKPMLLLLSDLNKKQKRKKGFVHQDNFNDVDLEDSLIM